MNVHRTTYFSFLCLWRLTAFQPNTFCDVFYFAIPVNFPIEIVPAETGLIVADQFGGEILRPSQHHIMTMGRRNRQIMQFARTAGMRLRKYDRRSGVLGRQLNTKGLSEH